MDINALAQKIVAVLGQTRESVLAAGSLAAAAHILSSGTSDFEAEVVPAPRQIRHSPPPIDNPGGLDVASLAREIALKMKGGQVVADPEDQRSLIDKWSGPLPSLNGRAKKVRPAPPNKPRIATAPPDANCPHCGESVNSHAIAKNLPPDDQGRPVYVICGNKFVHCERGDEVA